jgi:hypothetical protein
MLVVSGSCSTDHAEGLRASASQDCMNQARGILAHTRVESGDLQQQQAKTVPSGLHLAPLLAHGPTSPIG